MSKEMVATRPADLGPADSHRAPVPLSTPLTAFLGERPTRMIGSVLGSPTTSTEPAWWLGMSGAVALCLVAQGLMLWWAVDHHLLYGLPDALSQMTIARRLWDSPNPGIAQLGTGWLPLPQLFFSLPSLITPLWRTGVAGSALTIGCAAAASGAVFRIAERTGVGRGGAWLAALVMITNPSWSYTAVVPISEPFLIACICLATAGLMGWARSKTPYSPGLVLLFCGLPTAAAMLSGYEGWAFFAAALAVVGRILWTRLGKGAAMRRQLFAFAVLPLVASLWWAVFNWALEGNPLSWLLGPYAARTKNLALERLGLLPALGHPLTAATLYGRTVLGVVGTGTVALAIAGLVASLLCWHSRGGEVWLLLAMPVGAVIFALWSGDALIALPQSIPSGLDNTWYGIDALPLLAVAAAQVLRLSTLGRLHRFPQFGRAMVTVLVLATIASPVLGAVSDRLPSGALVVAEAERDHQLHGADSAAAGWLRLHATEGILLLDDATFAELPEAGIDLHRVVARFSRAWTATMAHPELATWVLVQPGNPADEVWRTLSLDGVFDASFWPVASFGAPGSPHGYVVVYKREDPAEAAASQLIPPPSIVPSTRS